MRKNMKFVLWILLATFVLWGGSSAVFMRSKGASFAGTVFGKKASWKEYEQNYNAVYNQAKLMYGEKFSQFSQYLNMEQEAWTRIILMREATMRHFNASDEEVIEKICSIPLFQDSSGKFVPDIYKRVIEYFLKVPAREFEDEVKGSIIITKLKDEIIKDVTVSDEELKKAYKEKNEKINVDYILINADDFKAGINVSEDKIKQYYDAHKNEFRTPLRVNIEYIPFEYSQAKKLVTVSDSEVDKYYQDHKKDYEKETDDIKKIKEKIKDKLLDKKAQDKADDASSDLSYEIGQQKQPNLKAIAKKFNLTVKESGFFAMNGLIPSIGPSYTISAEAFKLEPGQISSPIKSQTGRYIISLKNKMEPYVPDLNEIKDDIKNTIIDKEANELTTKRANELFTTIKQKVDSGVSFKDACVELKFEVKSTGQFTKRGSIPQIGNSEEFANLAFTTDIGKLAGIAKIDQGSAILFVSEKIAIDEEKFKTEKESFKKDTLEEKQAKYFEDWFEKLRQKADVKTTSAGMPKKKTGASQQTPMSIPMDDF